MRVIALPRFERSRAREEGRLRWRKDFECVFQKPDQDLVEFSEVTKMNLERNPNGTGDAVLIDPASVLVDKE